MIKKITLLLFFLKISFVSFAQKSRVFKEDFIVETQRFYPSDYELFRPVIFGMGINQNNLFIYDYSQHNLYALEKKDSQSYNVRSVGEGKGSGPKEFRNPSDMCITDEKIIISDTDLARISIWDIKSKVLIKSFKTKRFIPYRLTCYGDKIIVYNNSGTKDGNYLVYKNDGILIKGIKDNTLSNDGFLDSGSITADSSFIYFGSEGKPEIKKYNYLNDESVVVRYTIEKSEEKNKVNISKSDEEIRTKRDSEFKYQTRDIGLFQDYLVVFHSGRKDGHGNILDFYDKETLKYNFSVKLKHLFSNIEIQKDKLLINAYDFERQEREFYIFKMNKE